MSPKLTITAANNRYVTEPIRQRVFSRSVIRASELELGGSWVWLSPGVGNFSKISDLIEPKAHWKLFKSNAINNQTVTSRVDFHLAKRQKLYSRSFNAKISASCQWISVTHSGSYKLDKSVLSIASRIIYYIIFVTCYNKTKWKF